MSAWIDAHCHLAAPEFSADLPQVLERARQSGVEAWIQGGVDPEDWTRQAELYGQLGEAFVPVYGLHPWWVASHSEAEIEIALEKLASILPEAKGIGELGLDFGVKHGETASRLRQQAAFERQLELARSTGKPMVLHLVRSHPEALQILDRHGPFPQGGIVHSFSGSRAAGDAYLALGLTLSVGGGGNTRGFSKFKKSPRMLATRKDSDRD